MKNLKSKTLLFAFVGLLMYSCDKDQIENEESPTVAEITDVEADPSMEYYLHGKKITDKAEITDLLNNSMHAVFEEDKVTFYPTVEEQKQQIEKENKEALTKRAKHRAVIIYRGRHRGALFYSMTRTSSDNYGHAKHLAHISTGRKGKRAKISLFKKINAGVDILNPNGRKFRGSVKVRFHQRKNYGGQSRLVVVGHGKRKRNINLPWHIGSHRSSL